MQTRNHLIIFFFSLAVILCSLLGNNYVFDRFNAIEYTRDVRYSNAPLSTDSRPVLFVVEEKLLQEKQETAVVKKAKEFLGKEYSNLFFSDFWQIVAFLEELGLQDTIQSLVTEALKEKWLTTSAECAGIAKCEAGSINTNLNQKNTEKLVTLVHRYVDAAIEDAAKGNHSKARDIAQFSLRIFHVVEIDPTTQQSILDPYNYSYVLSAFLSLTEPTRHSSFIQDVKNLGAVILGEKKYSELEFRDLYVKNYAFALNRFRDGCMLEASNIYSDTLRRLSHDPLVQLFGFMSVRVLGRPFIDLSLITIKESNHKNAEKTLHINNCNSLYTLNDWKNIFNSKRNAIRARLMKPGFIKDLDYYYEAIPKTEKEIEIIISKIEILEKENKSREENAKIKAASERPNTGTLDSSDLSINTITGTKTPSEQPSVQTGDLRFQWPVRGRILSAYGRKPNGQQNDGVNISVPAGTPIRASEDGVVAYAGNELKGFGNLVLIRHADNWVTAYAHLESISVTKGQKVRRGDVIARAGETGGVTSPQLHFQIRKGSSPVDPETHFSQL